MLPTKENSDQKQKIYPSLNPESSSFHNCDIQKVTNGLYIGDQLVANNKKLLLDLDIKHVIVVGLQLKAFHPDHFGYLSVPVRDHRKQVIHSYFETTNKYIEKVLESNEAVLVHCAKGISRSATIVLAFLMYKYKMKSFEALVFVRRKRKQISPNEGFLFQLKKYEEHLGLKDQ